SNHILSAPEAPAPTAMQMSAMAASAGWSGPGATTSPTKAVKTTSDITRGFMSAMKSPTVPPPVSARLSRVYRTVTSLILLASHEPGCRPPDGIRELFSVVIRRLDTRHRLAAVEGRWRGERPLVCRRAFAPGIVRRLLLHDEVGVEHADKED